MSVPPAASISVNKDMCRRDREIVDTKLVALDISEIVLKRSKNQYISENDENI